jgi:MFS family permease
MAIGRLLKRSRNIYDEYPRQFWVLIVGMFIDMLGGALMFPFFTLYVTRRFEVGMTEVGILFGLFSISSVVGNVVGGALTDRLGRKGMIIFGLLASAFTSLLMGLVGSIELFFVSALVVGLFANAGGPARQAMVADLLPEEKRAQGFGILRVVANLAVTIGPAVGGLLAARSYLLLFICDAVASTITAGVVAMAIRETMPAAQEGQPEETVAQTFGGYLTVLRDATFVLFIGACVLMVIVYMQMNSTLAVYLRDSHGVSEQRFGYILSLNALMVVVLQFPIARRISEYPPLIVMAVGTLLYAIGFGMYGFVSAYVLFLVAMVIITIGEMLVAPVSQSLAARLAPEDMRGRYMAVFGFSYTIPAAVGPLLAGLIMDNADPRWVWYAAGIVGLVAVGAFGLLEHQSGRAVSAEIDERLRVLQMLEEHEISAEEAARRLQALGGARRWAVPAASGGADRSSRSLRVRVSDLTSGATKTDIILPMGLVNTVLYTGGRLADDLDGFDARALEGLIASGAADGGVETVETGDDRRLEISVEE